jgi:serine protease AprX
MKPVRSSFPPRPTARLGHLARAFGALSKPASNTAPLVTTAYIILIERRLPLRPLGALIATVVLLGALLGPNAAHADSTDTPKISADLAAGLAAPTTSSGSSKLLSSSALMSDGSTSTTTITAPQPVWKKTVNGIAYAKVIVVSNTSDAEMTNLRGAVLQLGGSVYYRYLSVRAISVLVPLANITTLALRSDVQTISPNRQVSRTASALELTSGVANVRTGSNNVYTGLDGTGIGIAVLDSGVAWNHFNMRGADLKATRVKRAVDFLKVGDAAATGAKDWTPGLDMTSSLVPGSTAMANYESKIAADGGSVTDAYGHGSHVASIAAGRGGYQTTDSTGIAPNATVFDVKVLDGNGYGQLSDVLAGIDWVILHAKEHGIRVINLSLAADSTETYLTDPLCRAARSATAAGITVVAAAGNFGLTSLGGERYGGIGAPGNDPSVITVGSVNTQGTAARGDDSVNFFSSRGPTRGAYLDPTGVRRVDNLLKPDLVAPGNKLVGAIGADKAGASTTWSLLAAVNSVLSSSYGGTGQSPNKALMNMSGTSIAAPVVAGTVALMLQANPGLTPPAIKAILQYSAQPIAGANLLQQGAGMLNVDGALKLSQALRTDLSSAVAAGTIAAGAPMLAAGKTMPAPSSVINGTNVKWSGLVFAGGNQILAGPALFTQFQPIYDPRLVWVRSGARRATVSYWPATTGVPSATFPKAIVEAVASNQSFTSTGVLSMTALAGSSSRTGKTGAFIPVATLSGWAAVGSGTSLSQGIVLSNGIVISEGLVLSEGVILSEGLVVSEGVILSEGLVVSEGVILSEAARLGEP